MQLPELKHPVSERTAAAFHAAFVLLYATALAFHAASAVAHWNDR